MQLADPQDPAIVARIGAYEEWPPLPDEEGLGSLVVGSEGMFDRFDHGDFVLWTNIQRLRVDVSDLLNGEPTANLVAEVVGDESPFILESGTPGAEFEYRVGKITRRLREYLEDAGVDQARWPEIDLRPRRESVVDSGEQRSKAFAALQDFERVAAASDDGALGHFVELRVDNSAVATLVSLAILGAAAGVLAIVGLVHLRFGQLFDILGGGFMVVFSARVIYSCARAVTIRDRRLRLGTKGLESVPGLSPTPWQRVRTVSAEQSYATMRLHIELDRPQQSIELTFGLLESPIRAKKAEKLQYLLYALLEADRVNGDD